MKEFTEPCAERALFMHRANGCSLSAESREKLCNCCAWRTKKIHFSFNCKRPSKSSDYSFAQIRSSVLIAPLVSLSHTFFGQWIAKNNRSENRHIDCLIYVQSHEQWIQSRSLFGWMSSPLFLDGICTGAWTGRPFRGRRMGFASCPAVRAGNAISVWWMRALSAMETHQ